MTMNFSWQELKKWAFLLVQAGAGTPWTPMSISSWNRRSSPATDSTSSITVTFTLRLNALSSRVFMYSAVKS